MKPTTLSFVQLASCLRGDPSGVTDWNAVLALANNTLLTPAIWSAISANDRQDLLPEDVLSFLDFIHRCNKMRNARLLAQLEELVVALNIAGIVPTLNKGTALLALACADRITRDIDVTVAGNERELAQKCLLQLGYLPIEALGWGRSKDVGAVDLHYPPGRYPQYWPSDTRLSKHSKEIAIGSGKARILSPTLQAQHWIVHDMLKDGHLWALHIDLRNLFELYRLTKEPEGIDWRELDILLSDPLGQAMLDTQLLALRSIFGTDIVQDRPVRAWIMWHHGLRSREYHPLLGGAVQAVGRIAWGIRILQIRWRFRGPWSELPGRIMRKGQKAFRTLASKSVKDPV